MLSRFVPPKWRVASLPNPPQPSGQAQQSFGSRGCRADTGSSCSPGLELQGRWGIFWLIFYSDEIWKNGDSVEWRRSCLRWWKWGKSVSGCFLIPTVSAGAGGSWGTGLQGKTRDRWIQCHWGPCVDICIHLQDLSVNSRPITWKLTQTHSGSR